MGFIGKPRYPAAIVAVVVAVLAFTAQADADGTAIGSYIPRFSKAYPPKPDQIDAQAGQVGRQPLIVSTYAQWRQPLAVGSILKPIWKRGSVPMITWEPFNYKGGTYPLAKIAGGKYDGYLRRSARQVARFGYPVLIRFAHEMNGSWYPWGVGVHGNTPTKYKRAWRHVVDVFREQGADNAQWVWAPQVNKDGRYPFKRLYPGDESVDWVGLDGFNAGLHGNWDSFTEIFGDSYNTLINLSSRPILVTETGSSREGGDTAEWMSSALNREIPNFGRIAAVVFFNAHFNGLDFRIDSSKPALRAFRLGVATSPYDVSRDEFLNTESSSHDQQAAPPPPSDDYGQPSLWYRLTQKLHGRYVWYAVAIAVGVVVLIAFAIWLAGRSARDRRGRVARHS